MDNAYNSYMTNKQLVARYKKWVALRKKGWTLQEIADEYGISRQAVQMRLSKGEPKESGGIVLHPELQKYAKTHKEGRGRSRMLVRIRDKFTCQDCGAVRKPEEVNKHNARKKTLKGRIRLFDVHHTHGECGKNSRGYDSSSDLSKMITLCHKCHFNRPEHKIWTKEYRANRPKTYKKK